MLPDSTTDKDRFDRRSVLKWIAAAGVARTAGIWPGPSLALGAEGAASKPVTAAALAARPTFRFPEKTDLIVLTERPANLETPIRFFREDLTPNEAFFVRWHLGIVPTRVDTRQFRLDVAGHVDNVLSLSLEQLKKEFEPASVVAVCQCSGNGRGLFQPQVPGGQWGNGAVGNAKWTGVKLSDLLKKAGVQAGAVDVTFGGMDKAPLPGTPPFVKSLPVGHEKVGDCIIAYAMNDQPLPMLNGFPLRLVVPGWYATYWVKALNEIKVTSKPYEGFWMAKAYRTAATPNMNETPTELAKETVPITDMTCRSILVTPEPGEKAQAGKAYEVTGVAFDSGKGIKQVEVSVDGGQTWVAAKLDPQSGKYAWRRFRHQFTPAAGAHTILSRATNEAGETQTTEHWNRSGYGRNLIESVVLTVA